MKTKVKHPSTWAPAAEVAFVVAALVYPMPPATSEARLLISTLSEDETVETISQIYVAKKHGHCQLHHRADSDKLQQLPPSGGSLLALGSCLGPGAAALLLLFGRCSSY